MRVSLCCGAPPISNGDCDTEDFGVCSSCWEFTEYVEEEELLELYETDLKTKIQTDAIQSNTN